MNFYEQNLEDWNQIQKKIFPIAVPKHCEWTRLHEIISILNLIGSKEQSNHMFYPTGGGLDIKSANVSVEHNCIEIFTGLTNIIKPKELIFESFKDPAWNYFRIETSELNLSGVYEDYDYPNEELTELSEGNYISRSYWDEGEYNGEKLPKSARVVIRQLKGSFVIFAKASYYNRHSATYDARHNKMNSIEFRNYIENTINNGWEDR